MSELTTIRELLDAGTGIGVLASAIEQASIFTWDRFGRFGKADDGARRRILDLLAAEHAWRLAPEPGSMAPMDAAFDANVDEFSTFGWPAGELPDLAALASGIDSRPQPQSKAGQTKARDTALVAVAALMREAGMDTGRGAAARICEAVERIGATMSQDTARQLLKDMDDALERRSR